MKSLQATFVQALAVVAVLVLLPVLAPILWSRS